MENGKKSAFIYQQVATQVKKQQEEGVLPKGTGSLNPFLKRKTIDKVNCPPKKLKVVTGPTIEETPPSTQLPPPHPGKGKGLIMSQGIVSGKCPVLLHKDSRYTLRATLVHHQGRRL